jgi:transcription elongation factor GreA
MATTDNKVLLTQTGLQKLQDELEHLQTTGRKEVADRLAEAISYGDLSENSEYDEAKNQQAFVEGRILELEEQIKHAQIITEEKKKGVVQIGSTVKVKRTGGAEAREYTLVGSTEADPAMHKISNESPVGAGILGKKKGDKIDIVAPGGKFQYEILGVS